MCKLCWVWNWRCVSLNVRISKSISLIANHLVGSEKPPIFNVAQVMYSTGGLAGGEVWGPFPCMARFALLRCLAWMYHLWSRHNWVLLRSAKTFCLSSAKHLALLEGLGLRQVKDLLWAYSFLASHRSSDPVDVWFLAVAESLFRPLISSRIDLPMTWQPLVEPQWEVEMLVLLQLVVNEQLHWLLQFSIVCGGGQLRYTWGSSLPWNWQHRYNVVNCSKQFHVHPNCDPVELPEHLLDRNGLGHPIVSIFQDGKNLLWNALLQRSEAYRCPKSEVPIDSLLMHFSSLLVALRVRASSMLVCSGSHKSSNEGRTDSLSCNL